jgi:hypothetical protein
MSGAVSATPRKMLELMAVQSLRGHLNPPEITAFLAKTHTGVVKSLVAKIGAGVALPTKSPALKNP